MKKEDRKNLQNQRLAQFDAYYHQFVDDYESYVKATRVMARMRTQLTDLMHDYLRQALKGHTWNDARRGWQLEVAYVDCWVTDSGYVKVTVVLKPRDVNKADIPEDYTKDIATSFNVTDRREVDLSALAELIRRCPTPWLKHGFVTLR